ncbi:MAG: HypC/HybG/HupF family hydrogenase formation chaperone [Candidatus Goldbacteria bacterium]|nr:HypC/HybG/HupF family hydrogenase formation chaperone [Candidatus Goldiibacteriota bacterium]
MCLAVPARIIEINGDYATADFNGVKRKISIQLTPDVKINEYCLVHAGFSIEKVTDEYAKEAEGYLREILKGPRDE